MNKIVAILLGAGLTCLLIGCNNSQQKGASNTITSSEKGMIDVGPEPRDPEAHMEFAKGTVDILGYDYSEQQHVLAADISCNFDGVSERRLKILLRPLGSPGNSRGASMSLMSGGELRFELDYEFDPNGTDWCRVTERTTSDVLAMVRSVDGDTIADCYLLNGATRDYHYTTAMLEYMTTGESGVQVSNQEAEYIDSIMSDYQQFADDIGSLDNNAHGELLVSVLSSPKFNSWLRSTNRLIHGEIELSKLTRDQLCLIAAICSRLKCLAGGIANPICHVCVGVSTACLIAEAVEWISGWFD